MNRARNFIRRHGLSDPWFIFLTAYMSILGISGCWIASDEPLANAVQRAIERTFS